MSDQSPDFIPVAGIRLGSASAGIRYQGRKDLVVIELAAGSTCAALFTRNQFCAAPVVVARDHLSSNQPRYLLINSGNANAGTGAEGVHTATESCRSLAALRGCLVDQVFKVFCDRQFVGIALDAFIPQCRQSLLAQKFCKGHFRLYHPKLS